MKRNSFRYFFLFSTSICLLLICLQIPTVSAQNYERYKILKDTTLQSKFLGTQKKLTITVPIEWQIGTPNKFPVIIVFDRQNKRSHQFILNSIDYLTSNEQMPSAVIISVESEQRFRYVETLHKVTDPAGKADLTEQFIFEEIIPMAQKDLKASDFKLFIGHSRYGYFTTSLFSNRIQDLNGVIALSPFFTQPKLNLTKSMRELSKVPLKSKKYYRFTIGNDFPEDFKSIDSAFKQMNGLKVTTAVNNPESTISFTQANLDMKGSIFKAAEHNVTPGIYVTQALYEIFEAWSLAQNSFSSINQVDLSTKGILEREIVSHYGTSLNFSLGVLNGKGWQFFNEKQYDKAIEAWKILTDTYPNFSDGYLYLLQAQKTAQKPYAETIQKFKQSLANSSFYNESQKKALQAELDEIINAKN